MRSELMPEEIESYRDNGFVIVEDFLDAHELEEWREALEQALAHREDYKLPPGTNNQYNQERQKDRDAFAEDDSFYSRVFVQRVNLWMDNPQMKELILAPEIGRMACDLEDLEAIRVWHDQTLIKAPWANPTSWHLDNPYWSFSSHHAASIWIALDDATIQNGCLYFLPGTHKQARFEAPSIGPSMGALFGAYPEWAAMKPVPAQMKAGWCSFHNGLTAHAAGPNMTPGFRRAMTCAMMPDGATFNGKQNVLPKSLFEQLSEGDPLNNDAQNPVIYSRTAAAV
jgi:ectoine hydroxylase-related dioxygenase (phytanoyl-CoA dioxygenase family)